MQANRDISMAVAPASIHGIVGENGAGKSTLMSIVYGFYEADSGEIRVAGQTVRIASSKDSIAHGIGMVHQHFMLVDTLSVLDNVMLGAEGGALLRRGAGRIRARLAELARDYGLAVDPDALVGDLGVGMQQRVEILKALLRGAKILILDEPTAVLTPAEADGLFGMLRTLKREGKTVVPDHPQAARDHGRDGSRFSDAARHGGRDRRHGRDIAGRARRCHGGAARVSHGVPQRRKSGAAAARGAPSLGPRSERHHGGGRRVVHAAVGRDRRASGGGRATASPNSSRPWRGSGRSRAGRS